jgi:3-keto-5-aminohexanoate cleavage enzyme
MAVCLGYERSGDISKDRVNWSHVGKALDRYGTEMTWRPYGYPEIVDPLVSAFADVDVLPRWPVPRTAFIGSAITGAFFSKRANPAQPVSTDEIRDSAAECLEAGASGIHIHVRDERGYNVLDPERFSAVIAPLRRRYPEALVDGCLVPAIKGEWEKMLEVLKLGLLDCVPVNTTASFMGDSLFAKPPHLMIEKTRLVQEAGAKVEIAVYTDADVDNARRYLIAPGLLEKPYLWIVLPALPGGSPMHSPVQMIDGLTRIVSSILDIDSDSRIVVCAAGRASTYLTALALAMGLHVRVGMEDSIWFWPHRDEIIGSNAAHLALAKSLAAALGRDVATGAQVRDVMGLPPSRAQIGAL